MDHTVGFLPTLFSSSSALRVIATDYQSAHQRFYLSAEQKLKIQKDFLDKNATYFV